MKKAKRLEVFFEFLVFGVVIGITEDIIAIKLATGEKITMDIFLIVLAIAIPFALIGEFIVDQIDFTSMIRKHLLKNKRRKRRRAYR